MGLEYIIYLYDTEQEVHDKTLKPRKIDVQKAHSIPRIGEKLLIIEGLESLDEPIEGNQHHTYDSHDETESYRVVDIVRGIITTDGKHGMSSHPTLMCVRV